MNVVTCRKCGFSLALATFMSFNNNGTITLRLARDFRVSLIEADFLTEIIAAIEKELGIPISHIAFEAQREASFVTIDRNLWGPLKVARVTNFNKRLAVNVLCRIAAWTGQGYAKTVVYKPGWLGEAIVRNPFDRELFASIVVGAFEALELKPFSHTWFKMGPDDVVSIRPEPSRPEVSKRLTFTTSKPKPGSRFYPRCPVCRVPEVLKLGWNREGGAVVDTHRGVRMAFLDAYTPKVIFRELAKELGEEIYPIIINAQREFSLRHLREEYLAGGEVGEAVDADTFYLAALDALALRGHGNPVDYGPAGGGLRVVVENSFEEHVLAGYLAAMYELGEKRRAEVSWAEKGAQAFEFTLTPA